MQEQKLKTTALLEENRHLIEALRDALLERHELIGHEITDILEAAQAAHEAVPATPRLTPSPRCQT